jgi:ATP-dependent DNA helicase RecQ
VEKSRNILKKYWGYEQFRPLQEDIVDAAIYGKDVLALLPTGGGKSICFQVPGIAREGICIVVSPLIALMNDQVDQLNQRGIRAKAITSAMTYKEIDIALDNARFGGLDFLYTSPERLKTKIFIERFKNMQVGLIVVDEAHCISEWGHDFRPPYREIHLLRDIHPEVPMIALTATATPEVKKDIVEQLKLRQPTHFEGSFIRPNISYEVYPIENKSEAIDEIMTRFNGLCGIIYCQRRKSVKEVAQRLIAQDFRVGIYHGGMDSKSRSEMMEAWMKGQLHVMVATNAFGMGIDKPNVRFVAHYEFPNNPEAYFQEAGRAGRDGKESRTFVFFEERDLEYMDQLIENQFPPIESVKNTYNALCNSLQLAIGSGENESFPVDLNNLVHHFNLDLIETFNSLKILEMNGDILFNEAAFQPTKVKFAVGNTTLYSFQIKHDKVSNLITLLSRSYPSIFDEFQYLHEKEFCKRLQINYSDLQQQLKFLESNGILDISWKTDKPIVTFLSGRIHTDYLSLRPEIYSRRKDLAHYRWKKMHHFLTKEVCRSQFLIEYFGQASEPCGKCDFCKSKTNNTYSRQEIHEMLETLLENSLSLNELKHKLEGVSKHEIMRVLQWMIQEEQVVYEKNKYKLK